MAKYIDERDDEDDDEPYSSVSARPPLQNVGAPGSDSSSSDDDDDSEDDAGDDSINTGAAAPMNPRDAIKAAILSRQAGAKDALSKDPLMQNFNDEQKKLGDLSQAKRQSDFISNMGQSFAQLAQGSNTPKLASNLYDNLANQNDSMMKSKQGELTRKEQVIKAIEEKQSREGVAADNRDARMQQARQHSQDLAVRSQDLSAQRQNSLDAKNKDSQDKAYTSMRHDLESFRGNQAAQQAAVKVQNADTALAIVKNKDPNSLTTQDLQLLADEMGKIATGGVPSEHGTQALLPNTLMSKLANMQSFLSNKPTDAQAGDFIKHNMDYLEEMKNVAKSTLGTYRANIAKGYKGRVRPEQYDEATQDYGFGSDPSAPSQGGGGGAPSSAPAQNKSPQGAHAPGSLVKYKGKMYRVGSDGDSLDEVM